VKVSIIVSDDEGNSYHGEAELASTATARPARKRVKRDAEARTSSNVPISLSSPIRAFVKQHARGMSGPQKFALLAAYLCKGDTNKQVLLEDIRTQWNKMKPLLGGKLNLAYPTRAKENEWVDSPKRGVYVVLPGWRGIFNA
jgi:hypothetical protein